MPTKKDPLSGIENPLALDQQVCFGLAVAARSVIALYRPLLEPLGLTHPQYLVMLALWEEEPLRVSELERDIPFNTRKHTGLPPGPIGNPGLASLEAAADPAHVGYLYYVVKPCGHGAHAFSSTDAQFQRDVAAYNRARAKAGGKSPVDC